MKENEGKMEYDSRRPLFHFPSCVRASFDNNIRFTHIILVMLVFFFLHQERKKNTLHWYSDQSNQNITRNVVRDVFITERRVAIVAWPVGLALQFEEE